MKLIIEVPEGVKRIQLFYYKPTSPVLQYAEHFGDQLQSMIVKDEPCEYCGDKDHKNDYGRTFYKEFLHDTDILTTLDDAHLQLAYSEKTGWVLHFEDEYGDRMFDVKISNCPPCGRPLGKDVE